MILKRIKLNNYRQHRALDTSLDGNIILIVGSNGKGKSNLIGAIQFALTGEQAGFKKDELLSWGAADGTVELWFQHDGVDGHVLRAIGSSRALFEYGTEVYNGITQVNDALKVRIGVDRDMARQAVFVKQGEIDEILFTDPKARELSFQRLMGIGDAAKIHKNMGDVLATLAAPQNYDEQIADGHKRRHEQTARLSEMQRQLSLHDSGDLGPTLEGLGLVLQSKSTTLSQLRRAQQIMVDMKVNQDSVDKAQRELQEIPAIDGDIQAIDTAIRDAEQLDRDATAWATIVDEYKRAGEAIIALGAAPTTQEDITAVHSRYEAAKAAVDGFRGQENLYASLQQSLTRVGTVTECPMCGSPITDVAQLNVRLANTILTLRQAIAVPASESQLLGMQEIGMKASLDQYQRDYNTKLARFQDVERRMKLVPQATADTAALQAQVQTLRQSKQAILSSITRRTQLAERIKGYQDGINRLNSSMADVGRTLEPAMIYTTPEACQQCISLVQDSIAKTTAAQTAEQQRLTTVASLQGSIRELTKAISALDDTIAVLELKQSQQGNHKAALETLNKVRDWFHYGNGPRTLASAVLGEMNQDINKFLSNFTAPFTVVPSDASFGFRCVFTDGRQVPKEGPPDATVLSGGQKVQLAIAFRFASYTMFANKLGLISLDEPTNFLDAANIGCFCNLMSQVKQIAKGMNLQVIMATHEESLMPFADTVVNLNEGS